MALPEEEVALIGGGNNLRELALWEADEATHVLQRSSRTSRRWRSLGVAAGLALAVCGLVGASITARLMPLNPRGAIGAAETSSISIIKMANGEEIVKYPVIFRDFVDNDLSKGIHMFGEHCTRSSQMVKETIGPDGKPQWQGVVGQGGISTQREFDALWNTDPTINKEIRKELVLIRDPRGDFRHDSPEFFPLDEGPEHNYYFSMEMHTSFTYKGGEIFDFRGDDDVYLFINGVRVVNLGGCHRADVAEVHLDDLGLTVGQKYPFDFFFAERRCCSSSLRIETTMQLDDPVPLPPGYQCCVTHVLTKDWSWICYDTKRFFWCAEQPHLPDSDAVTPKGEVGAGEAYKCCVTHLIYKGWSNFCYDHKKFPWCGAVPV